MGRLILLRHGQSAWNLQNRFTGWVDVSLSEKGIEEAEQVGELLAGIRFDTVFISTLIRAQNMAYEVLKYNSHCDHYKCVHESDSEWYEHYTPTDVDRHELTMYVSEALNERYYGDLQGLNKAEAAQQFGAEQVHIWRRSYNVPPPNGESLAMTAKRTLPYYHERIEPLVHKGQTVLVTAHGNSLRAMIMRLENMAPEQILQYELATGAPHIYDFDGAMHLVAKHVLTPGKSTPDDVPKS